MSRHQHSATCNCSAEAKEQQGIQESLLGRIVVDNVREFNAQEEGSAKRVFKTWAKRLERKEVCESEEDDPELIIVVPFTAQCKVLSFCVIGDGDCAPSKVKLWVNREDIDFTNHEDVRAAQEVELQKDPDGYLYYPLQQSAGFKSAGSVTLFFPATHGGDHTTISYIDFRGESTGVPKKVIANVVYEAVANPADHQKSKAESRQGTMGM